MQFTINFTPIDGLWEGLEHHYGEYVVRSIESIMGGKIAPMHEAEALALYKVDGSVVTRLNYDIHFNLKAGYMHATLCTGDAPDDMAIRITAHDADHNPCMYDDAEYLFVAITDVDMYTAESVNPDSTWSEWGTYRMTEVQTKGESAHDRLRDRLMEYESGLITEMHHCERDFQRHMLNGNADDARIDFERWATANWLLSLLEPVGNHDAFSELKRALKNGYVWLAHNECFDREDRAQRLAQLEDKFL